MVGSLSVFLGVEVSAYIDIYICIIMHIVYMYIYICLGTQLYVLTIFLNIMSCRGACTDAICMFYMYMCAYIPRWPLLVAFM